MVGRHLEQLDSSFLSTLDAYIQGAGDRGAADVAGAQGGCIAEWARGCQCVSHATWAMPLRGRALWAPPPGNSQ